VTDVSYNRVYLEQSVYAASQERLRFVFDNFERIYISFSGGKDSGVLLNLVLQYIKAHEPGRKVGVMILDNEGNYTYSLEFMHRILKANREHLEIYWGCLPITLPCAVSMYQSDWKCWGVADEERWIYPMPTEDYVINMRNHPFGDLFIENMHYDDYWNMFAEWYSQGKRCANLIGIRTDESLRRFCAIIAAKEGLTLGKQMWTKRNTKHVYNCYPIYDWRTDDIWTANARFEWDYNKLYDVFYMADIPISKMRVASPFMDESKSSLNMYRIIDPPIWARMCSRVMGANFAATYGKQINYKSFKLPPGHTWKSFVKFLLSTLPDEVAQNFKERFAQSIRYWSRTGRGVSDKTLAELRNSPLRVETNGRMLHGRKNKLRVRIRGRYPDHTDFLSCNNRDVASWKRLAITILKNDHICKYMGLAPTKRQMERQKEIQAKYGSVITNRKEDKDDHQDQ
jgi:predicted phosphoadenosine phosphosulfate sulfurtransferase